jgi:ribosome biogenesis GTPase
MLGWDATFEAAFARLAPPDLLPGRVALEHNQFYRVLTENREWLAEATGRMKFRASGRDELPAVGDWVGIRPGPDGEHAAIRVILPRRTVFSRKASGRPTEEQVLAANIDDVFLVSTLEIAPKPRSIERYLLLARQSGARPVILLNKADLALRQAQGGADELAAVVAEVMALAPDVPVHAISARDGSGFDALDAYLAVGRTVALLGPSGAGKSSIVNRLAEREVVPTGEVREWDARGRHTSVHRELKILERGGILIDTPGLRELQAWESDASLEDVFADVEALGADCRFGNCRHDTEPGCAVKAAVEDGRLDASRYGSFLKLTGEREMLEAQQLEQFRKRQGRLGAKAIRQMKKTRGR